MFVLCTCVRNRTRTGIWAACNMRIGSYQPHCMLARSARPEYGSKRASSACTHNCTSKRWQRCVLLAAQTDGQTANVGCFTQPCLGSFVFFFTHSRPPSPMKCATHHRSDFISSIGSHRNVYGTDVVFALLFSWTCVHLALA